MLKVMKEKSEKQEDEKNYKNFEAKQNLLGFFNKLLEIDMRKNPEKYKKPKQRKL